MEQIDYCLDRILQELRKNWNDSSRPPLKAEELLREFKAPEGRHEFFKGLIEKLHKDGFIRFLNPYSTMETEMDYYQRETILSVEGYYLIENGGYRQKSINTNQERERIRVLETYPNILNRRTLWVVYGTFFLGFVELLKWCYDNHWFPFCGH